MADEVRDDLVPPNGGLHLTTSLHPTEEVSSAERLDQVLDEIVALSSSAEIGQMLELRASIDEVLMVSIDEPRHGWSLLYDNSVTRTSVASDNGSGDEEPVSLRFAENCEEVEAQYFIDAPTARRATLDYLSTRRLADDVHWAGSADSRRP